MIELDGEPVTGASERALSALRRRRVGFVFQFFHLLPELSGEANVLLAARVRGAHPDAARRARELVDSLGLRRSPSRFRISSRAASSSASRSRGRSSTTRRSCSPTSRPATSTSRPAPGCWSCCAPAPTRGARSCSSPTSGRRPRSPTGCCASTRGGWSRREAAPVARGGGHRGGVGRGRDRDDGRLRALHRLRPRRARRRPARRGRALRPRAPLDARRARPRAPEPRGALVPARAHRLPHGRRRRPLPAPRDGPDRARRPPRLRDHLAGTTCRRGRARS